MLRPKTQVVNGMRLPAPRLTLTGLRLILQYCAAPIVGALISIDIALYFYFREVYGVCYGVWCWF
ncbi:MAG: hypothetical protein AAF936_11100 [Pseudomonadota bacterium]